MKKIVRVCRSFVLVALLSSIGCTQAALFQQESVFGSLLGAGTGAGIAALVAENNLDEYMKNETIAVGGGIGAAAGLIAGGLLYDSRALEAQALRPVRQPYLVDPTDTWSLDEAYEQVQESTKEGRGEVSPWEERYWGDTPNIPYQGPQL